MKNYIFAAVGVALTLLTLTASAGRERTASAATGDPVHTTVDAMGCGLGMGVAFDGKYLWFSCDFPTIDLHRTDPLTGAVSFLYHSGSGSGAIAYDANHNGLWTAVGFSASVPGIQFIQLDANKDPVSVTPKFDPGLGDLIDGIAYDATDDTLYMSEDGAQTIHHYTTSGALLDVRNWAQFGTCQNSGLAIGGNDLFQGANGCTHVWVTDKVSNAPLFDFSTVAGGGRDEGLSCDSSTFSPIQVMWSRDAFNASATAFEIPRGTCGTGGRPPACPDGVISPSHVEAVIFPGQSTQIEKCVEVPRVPPKPDIVFLADTTGSMGPALANVQSNAGTIMTLISLVAPNAQFAAADYKDFACNVPSPNIPYELGQAVTASSAAVQTAINAWSAPGGAGCDEPEAQLFALHKIATDPAVAFRPGATRIVAWFGDCPGHDPVPVAATGLGSDLTEASVTAELVAANIKVVAVSLNTECPGGLDGDPAFGGGGYNAAYGTIEGGSAGQATRITSATGGSLLTNISPPDVSTAILAAIGQVSVQVAITSNCSGPITTTFSPPSQTVTSGSIVTFTETITVAATAPGGTYECDDFATIDGSPLLDATGAPAREHKTIKVPQGFLTGGGQIASTKGKNANKVSFGGNVGFLADFSTVGEWETNFHDVAGTEFDKGKFHSTSITSLQFYKDSGAGPGNPPASANVGNFTAVGRFNGQAGWTLKVCLADRGEPGKNDSIRVQLYRPNASLAYDSFTDFPSQDNTLTGVCANRTKLSAGNFQIHSGLKN